MQQKDKFPNVPEYTAEQLKELEEKQQKLDQFGAKLIICLLFTVLHCLLVAKRKL
jgi:hypothetical protein